MQTAMESKGSQISCQITVVGGKAIVQPLCTLFCNMVNMLWNQTKRPPPPRHGQNNETPVPAEPSDGL